MTVSAVRREHRPAFGTHMDLYDVPKYVDRTVAEAVPFLREDLAVTAAK